MLWAAAIPHFFDSRILAALRPELADQAEKLNAALKTLTFVEDFPEHGYNIHELTRTVLLRQLWGQNQEEFLILSERAANYFFNLKTSPEEDVEFFYHEVLNEEGHQTGRLLDRAIDWWTYYQIDRFQAAIQSLLEHKKAERLDTFGRAFLLHLNGLIQYKHANYKEAEIFFEDAQANYKSIRLKNSRYITTLLRDLSSSKRKQGLYKNAINICESSLSICEEQLGANHPDTATSLNNLAGLYQGTGRYREAEPLYVRALQIVEEQLGENHPDTATSLNNLASLYKNTGRYGEAEPLYVRALQIVEEQLGENHP
ncbi:tetratricopeptide repeat protein, partial [Pseudanabaena sp. FACHB-2040]|nr:tetratricopeptide repeat protein [Pseudanabaena sp. FACHB-2040]